MLLHSTISSGFTTTSVESAKEDLLSRCVDGGIFSDFGSVWVSVDKALWRLEGLRWCRPARHVQVFAYRGPLRCCRSNDAAGRPSAGSGKLQRARSRRYRSQILQVNMPWKALAEIYTMHSFAPFSWDRSREIRLGEEIYENLNAIFCLKIDNK